MATAKKTVLLLCILAGGGLLFSVGFPGDFVFDDTVHVSRNPLVAISALDPVSLKQAFFSSPFEFPHSRPLSMLSFGLNHALGGSDPLYFKMTNVAIHLLNGLVVFFLARLLALSAAERGPRGHARARVDWVALATAAAWLMHPINLTPTLYVVQRMTSLAALFSFLGLLCYLTGRRRMIAGKGGIGLVLSSLVGFLPLGFLCKENAVLLPVLMLATEITLFRFQANSITGRRFIQGFFFLSVVVPLLTLSAYLTVWPEWLVNGYGNRNFNLTERMLTEPRILWFYLRMIFLPNPGLFGLFHDDIAVSKSLLDPPVTLAALFALIALALTALWLRGRFPMLAFGVLFFLAGHALESSFFPLELAYEHRNYVPSLGPLLTLFYYLIAMPARRRILWQTGVAASLMIGLFALNTGLRASFWADKGELYLAQAANHPNSPRANFQAGTFFVSSLGNARDRNLHYRRAFEHFARANNLNPRNCDGLFGLIVLKLHTAQEIPDAWLTELRHRLRNYPFSPENITTSQFAYLVQWQLAPGTKMPSEDLESLFQSLIGNPTLDRYARAGLYNLLRLYHDRGTEDATAALRYAHKAVETWPERLEYRSELISLLLKHGRIEEARAQLGQAEHADRFGASSLELNRLRSLTEAAEHGGSG